MTALLVAVLALFRPTPATGELATYMAALDSFLERQRQVADLAASSRIAEAQQLLNSAVPAGLDPAFDPPRPILSNGSRMPESIPPAGDDLASFLLRIGFPETAAPTLETAARRGRPSPSRDLQVFLDLHASGQNDGARRWAVTHPDLQGPVVAGILQHPEVYEGRGGMSAAARGAARMWRERAAAPDIAFFDALAAHLPPRGQVLALEAGAGVARLSPAERGRRLRQAAKLSGKDLALDAWRRLAEAEIDPYLTGEALYQWGGLELARGDARAAVPLLRRAGHLDPDLLLSAAQRKLGFAHFAEGDYAAALQAWARAEAESSPRPQMGCCPWYGGEEHDHDYRLWQGLALERMGRIDEALAHYLRAIGRIDVAVHVLDLYEAAGQFTDVERLFVEATPSRAWEYPDAVPGLSMLVLRRMARAGDWPSLVAAALAERFDVGDVVSYEPGKHSLAREAMRLLARNCAATVPLVQTSMAAASGERYASIRALGVCATPAAVEALVAVVAERNRGYEAIAASQELRRTALGRAALTAQGEKMSPLPAHDPESDPEPVFPRADGRPLPTSVTPLTLPAARRDPLRWERLMSQRCRCDR